MADGGTVSDRIEAALREKLQAKQVSVVDESWRHANHEGAKSGGHYVVTVVSPEFAGQSRVDQQRMVYRALGSIMDEIHALQIEAREA